MLKRNTGFAIVSILIFLSDIIFIVLNYYSALNTFKEDIGEWAIRTENFFRITYENKAVAMQKIATFIANDPRVTSLFKEGKEAVISEGGGPGKEKAAIFRQRLFDVLYPSWIEMTKKYDVRQLHFHLGPGSTSFLRIHRPEKFGDNMDDVRFTVVDANKFLESTKGFETGRVYSGIRGVVPVFYDNKDTRKKEHIGALEAGTSFAHILESLHENLGCEFSVLLTKEHVHKNMWKEFVTEHFGPELRIGDNFIEATTGQRLKDFKTDKAVWENLKSNGHAFINKTKPLQACIFPLRDYRGSKNTATPASGIIIVTRDATGKWIALKKNVKTNIIYALLALLIVEIILYLAWQFSRKKLTDIINEQTEEISKNYERLKALIESFPIAVLIIDLKSGQILEANSKFVEMTGAKVKDIEGSSKADFISIEKLTDEHEDISLLKNFDNKNIYVLIQEVETEIQGQEISIVSLIDMTQKRQMETERMVKEKLQGVLEMAGAICHEINQPLMVISGYSDLLMEDFSKEGKHNKGILQIKAQTERLGNITKKLMRITRYQTRDYLNSKIIDIDKASGDNKI